MEVGVLASVLEAEWRRLINAEDLSQVSENKKSSSCYKTTVGKDGSVSCFGLFFF